MFEWWCTGENDPVFEWWCTGDVIGWVCTGENDSLLCFSCLRKPKLCLGLLNLLNSRDSSEPKPNLNLDSSESLPSL